MKSRAPISFSLLIAIILFYTSVAAQSAPPQPGGRSFNPTVIVYLKNGQNWPAQIAGFDTTKRSVYFFGFGQQHEIRFDEIKSIVLQREQHMANGMIFGASAGCLLGALFANNVLEPEKDQFLLDTKPYVYLFGCMGATAGMLAGGIAGASTGVNRRIRFDKMTYEQQIRFLERITK